MGVGLEKRKIPKVINNAFGGKKFVVPLQNRFRLLSQQVLSRKKITNENPLGERLAHSKSQEGLLG
jgi:hypothetical protein